MDGCRYEDINFRRLSRSCCSIREGYEVIARDAITCLRVAVPASTLMHTGTAPRSSDAATVVFKEPGTTHETNVKVAGRWSPPATGRSTSSRAVVNDLDAEPVEVRQVSRLALLPPPRIKGSSEAMGIARHATDHH